MWSNDDEEEIQGSDKYKACVPYVLPLLDGNEFGHYIYERIPPLGFVNDLLLRPLLNLYDIVPFMGLILFCALTLGTLGNTNIARTVRFNAQQAALIDVALILPELVREAVYGVDVPRYLAEPSCNFVWYTYMAMISYSVYNNLRGKKPGKIPFISDYANLMVGPF